MNNEIYNRLLKLFNELGISALDKTVENAELKGYSAGIELADKVMNETYQNMFIDTANDSGISMYLNLINETKQATIDETRKIIIDAISDTRGFISRDEFDKAVTDLGSSCKYTVSDGVITISSAEVLDEKFLNKISYFIKNYVPAFLQIKFDGNGLTFEQWEKLILMWCKIDNSEFPFSVIDTLKIN